MNTEEGNKLIAEFMGDVFCPDGYYKETEMLKYSVYPECWQTSNHGVVYVLQYHSSWDWLIPACKKFDKLNLFDVEYESLCDAIDNAVSCYEIKSAWRCLIKGIEWLNSEQSVKESDTSKAT